MCIVPPPGTPISGFPLGATSSSYVCLSSCRGCPTTYILSGNNAINTAMVVIIIQTILLVVLLAISAVTIVLLVKHKKKQKNQLVMDNTNSSNPAVYEVCQDTPIYESLDDEKLDCKVNGRNCTEKSEEHIEPYNMCTCSAYKINEN